MIYKNFKEYIQNHDFDDKNNFNDLLDTLKNRNSDFIKEFFKDEPFFQNYKKRDMIVMATRVHHLCLNEYQIDPPN